jgi:hypothetical protein
MEAPLEDANPKARSSGTPLPDNHPAGVPTGFAGSVPSKSHHVAWVTSFFSGSYANIQSPEGTENPDALAVTALAVVFTTTSSGTPMLAGDVAAPSSNV